MTFEKFFEKATGNRPYPYQARLGTTEWPELVDVPTGLGKTGAVAVAWLYRQYRGEESTPKRLVWCLPMRVLVEQTCGAIAEWVENVRPLFEEARRPVPTVETMMGGLKQTQWASYPEWPAVVVGTQDMLLSRALMRGYGMSRYAWPMQFAWLHNDALWVFDETQLMGVAVETSAQLEAFRGALGTAKPSRTIWMSATLGQGQLDTVDHHCPPQGWRRLGLDTDDLGKDTVLLRTGARKAALRSSVVVDKEAAKDADKKKEKSEYATQLAQRVTELHQEGTLTLVIVNRVSRAQALYAALAELEPERNTALLHSRFRAPDRQRHAEVLTGEGDRIVIATQVVEAGVDVSARTLVTELAPWSSLVQRFGRCNRYGEYEEANVEWVDVVAVDERDDAALPYDKAELDAARELLAGLQDVGPRSLADVVYEPPEVIRPVIRRKDLIELFDTTSDLAGNDLDVSRYVRDESNDSDITVFWRAVERPDEDDAQPIADELCSVTISAISKFTKKKGVTAFVFDPLQKEWVEITKPRPGQTLLIPAAQGGYDTDIGFTGEPAKKNDAVPTIGPAQTPPPEALDGDRASISRWLSLLDHVSHVVDETRALCDVLHLDGDWSRRLEVAANWHDVGKAHHVFQKMMTEPGEKNERYRAPDETTIWAKSNHQLGRAERKHFRHELASALAYLQHASGPDVDVVAYLIAAHHGKVRLSIRSLPGESEPTSAESEGLFARGVWHGDVLPAVTLPDGTEVPETKLDLRVMRLGEGSWLERTLRLRDDGDIGPFRLAWFESILRLGDQRASAKERDQATDDERDER